MKIPCHGRLFNTYDAVDFLAPYIASILKLEGKCSKINKVFSGYAVSWDFSKLGASRACRK